MTWLRLLAPDRTVLAAFLVMLLAVTSAGCEAIGDIFQAGMAVGVLMVVIVIAIIGFIVAKIRT
jgi:hypothetical protein